MAAAQAQSEVDPGCAVAQALLAGTRRPGGRDARGVSQVFAHLGGLRWRDELGIQPGLGVIDAVEHRLLEVDRRERATQHLVVDQAGIARLQQ